MTQMLRRISLIMLLFTTLVIIDSDMAGAGTSYPGSCPHGGNKTDSFCLNDRQNIGGFATWHLNWLNTTNLGSGAQHINETLWVYQGDPESTFGEIGTWNGRFPPTVPGSCGCQAYSIYRIEDNGPQHQFVIANVSPNGSTTQYQISKSGSNWYFYYNYNYIATSNWMANANSIDVQVGLEIQVDCNCSAGLVYFQADTFNSFAQYRDTGGVWRYWPTHNSYRDYPCGIGYSPPFCTNGWPPVQYEWSNNKPY